MKPPGRRADLVRPRGGKDVERLRAAVLACALLGACGALPPANPPPSGEAAVIEANRRADAYFRGGNLEGAARYYAEAVRLARSVEDAEGIAANAISLSIVFQHLGRHAEARATLAPVLEDGRLTFSPERLAQAALRRSILDLDERRLASSAGWVDRAAAHCGQRGCALSGAIHNVKGQLALETGDLESAAANARAALGASRAAGDRAETANALRLLGLAAVRGGNAAGAAASFGEALALDRELAVPRKIYLDLVGLGQASALKGDRRAARSYYERALAVSEAARDGRNATEARSLIDAAGEPPAAR